MIILVLLVHEHTFSDTNSFWLSDLTRIKYGKCYTRLPDVGTHTCIILDIMSHYCTLPNTIIVFYDMYFGPVAFITIKLLTYLLTYLQDKSVQSQNKARNFILWN